MNVIMQRYVQKCHSSLYDIDHFLQYVLHVPTYILIDKSYLHRLSELNALLSKKCPYFDNNTFVKLNAYLYIVALFVKVIRTSNPYVLRRNSAMKIML